MHNIAHSFNSEVDGQYRIPSTLKNCVIDIFLTIELAQGKGHPLAGWSLKTNPQSISDQEQMADFDHWVAFLPTLY